MPAAPFEELVILRPSLFPLSWSLVAGVTRSGRSGQEAESSRTLADAKKNTSSEHNKP